MWCVVSFVVVSCLLFVDVDVWLLLVVCCLVVLCVACCLLVLDMF